MNDDRATLERFRIHELIGRYVDALNHRDWDAYQALWADDCSLYTVFEIPPAPVPGAAGAPPSSDFRLIGIDEIMAAVRRYNDISWLFQLPHGIVVELESECGATARHSLHIVSQYFTMIGIRYDRFARGADGNWCFVHRDYRPSYYEIGSPPGSVTRRLPAPGYTRLFDRDGN